MPNKEEIVQQTLELRSASFTVCVFNHLDLLLQDIGAYFVNNKRSSEENDYDLTLCQVVTSNSEKDELEEGILRGKKKLVSKLGKQLNHNEELENGSSGEMRRRGQIEYCGID